MCRAVFVFELLLDELDGAALGAGDGGNGGAAAFEELGHQVQEDGFALQAGWGIFDDLVLLEEGQGKAGVQVQGILEQMDVLGAEATLENHPVDPARVEVKHAVHPALVMPGEAVMNFPRGDGDHAAGAAQVVAASIEEFFHPAAYNAYCIPIM